jgi:hypothetical protein
MGHIGQKRGAGAGWVAMAQLVYRSGASTVTRKACVRSALLCWTTAKLVFGQFSTWVFVGGKSEVVCEAGRGVVVRERVGGEQEPSVSCLHSRTCYGSDFSFPQLMIIALIPGKGRNDSYGGIWESTDFWPGLLYHSEGNGRGGPGLRSPLPMLVVLAFLGSLCWFPSMFRSQLLPSLPFPTQ